MPEDQALAELAAKFAELETHFVQLLQAQLNTEERMTELETLIDEVLFDYQNEISEKSERIATIKARLTELAAGADLGPLCEVYETRIIKNGNERTIVRVPLSELLKGNIDVRK